MFSLGVKTVTHLSPSCLILRIFLGHTNPLHASLVFLFFFLAALASASVSRQSPTSLLLIHLAVFISSFSCLQIVIPALSLSCLFASCLFVSFTASTFYKISLISLLSCKLSLSFLQILIYHESPVSFVSTHSILSPIYTLFVSLSHAPLPQLLKRITACTPCNILDSRLTCNMPCIYPFIILLLALAHSDSVLYFVTIRHIKKG